MQLMYYEYMHEWIQIVRRVQIYIGYVMHIWLADIIVCHVTLLFKQVRGKRDLNLLCINKLIIALFYLLW